MSIICGIIDFDRLSIKKEEIQKMLDCMSNVDYHNESTWVDKNIGFGHKLFCTTPESHYENQPLINQEKNIILNFDGRIDNRNELFEQLDLNEDDFDVVTDADLVLWSYEKWGKACVQYLIGDFSFALWDVVGKELVCSRDRLGIRPFYFYMKGSMLYFASDIRMLLEGIGTLPEPDFESIKSFAHFGTIGYEKTMYENIYRIPPAYTYSFTNKVIEKQRYWFPEHIKQNREISLIDASKKVRELLSESIDARLRVTGKVGCELSGGIDSTSIAFLMTEQSIKKNFSTFSMRYRSYSCDEWEYTHEAINKLELNSFWIDVDELDFKNKYNIDYNFSIRKSWPFFGSFTQNLALVEEMQKQNMRVVLTGHGGDNLFTGSTAFLYDYARGFHFVKLFQALRYYGFSYENIKRYVLRPLIPGGVKNIMKCFLRKVDNNSIPLENFDSFWGLEKSLPSAILVDLGYLVGRHQNMFSEMNYYLTAESLYGIEFRHPFFDTRLIEFALSLPPEYKLRNGLIKAVLREAMKDLLPEKIYAREDKAEFSEALLEQMAAIDMKTFWKNSFLKDKHIVENILIDNFLLKYQQGKLDADEIGRFWRLLTLEKWYEVNFD